MRKGSRMKKIKLTFGTVLAAFLLIAAAGFGAEQKPLPEGAAAGAKTGEKGNEKAAAAVPAPKGSGEAESTTATFRVPLFSPLFANMPVASIDDDTITLEELNTTLASIHGGAAEGKSAGKKDFTVVLNRLINSRLIPLEAENMGLGDLPKMKKAVEAFKSESLKEELKLRQIKDLKPDEATVERYYKDIVKEWKIKSVRFDKDTDAKDLLRDIQAGGNFDELTNKLVEGGKAQGGKEAEFIKPKDLLPQVAAFLSKAKTGDVSPVIAVGPAFTVLKLEDIRYPSGNAEAKAEASQHALELKELQTLNDYNEALTKRYVKINQKLLKKLDFEAKKPGLAKLSKDKRVIAAIKGQKPITVADLVENLKANFFHGIDEAISQKKVNSQKLPVLQNMLYNKVYPMEADRLGIEKTDSYKNKVKTFRDSILFGAFIEKVVAPDVKMTDDDIKAYYGEHVAEYSYPEMMWIKSLVFINKAKAEGAIDKLRKGTEYEWLKANADGLAPKDSPGIQEFPDSPLVTKTLSDKVQEAVAGAKSGDVRLYETPEGYFYVLVIKEVVPAKPQPLQEIRKTIEKKLFNSKLNKAVEDWGTKLRDAYKVKIYVTDLGK